MNSSGLDDAIAALARRIGWKGASTADHLVRAWARFVAKCERCFNEGYDEMTNDRSVRTFIEEILNESGIGTTSGFQHFATQVTLIDERYRVLLDENNLVGSSRDPWWERGVLRFGGDELVEDFWGLFGVRIHPCTRETGESAGWS